MEDGAHIIHRNGPLHNNIRCKGSAELTADNSHTNLGKHIMHPFVCLEF